LFAPVNLVKLFHDHHGSAVIRIIWCNGRMKATQITWPIFGRPHGVHIDVSVVGVSTCLCITGSNLCSTKNGNGIHERAVSCYRVPSFLNAQELSIKASVSIAPGNVSAPTLRKDIMCEEPATKASKHGVIAEARYSSCRMCIVNCINNFVDVGNAVPSSSSAHCFSDLPVFAQLGIKSRASFPTRVIQT